MKKALLIAIIMINFLNSFSQSISEKTIDTDSTEYAIVKEMPVFEYKQYKDNGSLSLQKYLEDNFNKDCTDCYGGVFVLFVVEKDGKIRKITFINAPNGGFCTDDFKNRLEKALKDCPSWIPGYQNGVPKRVRYSLPFHFKKSKK